MNNHKYNNFEELYMYKMYYMSQLTVLIEIVDILP